MGAHIGEQEDGMSPLELENPAKTDKCPKHQGHDLLI